MTIEQVKKILTGKFETETDRQYWIDKLEEMEQKEKNATENEDFYKSYRGIGYFGGVER